MVNLFLHGLNMRAIETYYLVYDAQFNEYLTAINSWSPHALNALRISNRQKAEADVRHARHANTIRDVKLMICQVSMEMEEV